MNVRRVSLLLTASLLAACTSAPKPAPEMKSLSGAQLYQQLCASCHGLSGRGDGPVAPLIKIPVPDLTRIAARAGGEFPVDQVKRTIDGREDHRAHGARDMPVWGWNLYPSNPDPAAARAETDALIGRVVSHLQSIQRR